MTRKLPDDRAPRANGTGRPPPDPRQPRDPRWPRLLVLGVLAFMGWAILTLLVMFSLGLVHTLFGWRP